MWPWLTISAWILPRIDLQQAHIVDDRRRGVAEVEQDRAAARRRAAIPERARGPTRCAGRCARPRCGRARAFVHHAVDGAAAQELIVLLIDQHADRELVDRSGPGSAARWQSRRRKSRQPPKPPRAPPMISESHAVRHCSYPLPRAYCALPGRVGALYRASIGTSAGDATPPPARPRRR